MKLPIALSALFALTGSVDAAAPQDPCEGNGQGGAYISTTSAIINGTLELDLGSTAATSGIVFLSVSSDFGPVASPFPFLPGTLCLNPFAPGYQVLIFPLDPGGNAHLSIPISGVPGDVLTNPPIFADSLTIESGPILSLSKTVRTSFENPNSHRRVGSMSTARAFQTVTALGIGPRDNRTTVLVAGGGSGSVISPGATISTEIYDPLSRTFSAGPNMSQERTFHAAVRLQGGQVLIAGGVDSNGVATTSADIYDRDLNLLAPTGSMTAPRAGHSLTLLNDGRVLACGGLADFQNAAANFIQVLNSAQNTAEIFDPSTNNWSPATTTMSSKRTAHRQEKLPDGRVLVISGINGASFGTFSNLVPTFTTTCDIFDPVTNGFVPTATLLTPGRAFFGSSSLGSGDVLITGGIAAVGGFFEATSISNASLFDPGTESWSNTGSLASPISFHSQERIPDGRAYVAGGFLGDITVLNATALSGVHDGIAYSARALVGTNVGIPLAAPFPTGAGGMTLLHDGTLLLVGGFNTVLVETTFNDSFIFQL